MNSENVEKLKGMASEYRAAYRRCRRSFLVLVVMDSTLLFLFVYDWILVWQHWGLLSFLMGIAVTVLVAFAVYNLCICYRDLRGFRELTRMGDRLLSAKSDTAFDCALEQVEAHFAKGMAGSEHERD